VVGDGKIKQATWKIKTYQDLLIVSDAPIDEHIAYTWVQSWYAVLIWRSRTPENKI